MLKSTFTVIILFIYLNAFTLSCEHIIHSESTELLISLGESLYKGKLNISNLEGIMQVTNESSNYMFPESSELKVGDLTLVVKSCKTDNHKSYLTVKYKSQPEFDLEIHSQGASIMDYNSDLSEQKLLEFLTVAQKPEEKKSLFNKSNEKHKRNFRKTDGQYESEDELEDQDLQSSTKKANITSAPKLTTTEPKQQPFVNTFSQTPNNRHKRNFRKTDGQYESEDESEDQDLQSSTRKARIDSDPELTTNEFNQQPSVQPYSKILNNPSLCGQLLEHGSGLYKFCTPNRCNTIYLYSVDYIKYWYSSQNYMIESRKEIPDNIFSYKKYILKSCHDVKSQKFENFSDIKFYDYKYSIKDAYASSVKLIQKADINNVSKLYTNDLDKHGTYELYDSDKVLLGRLIINYDPHYIQQEILENEYTIKILYDNIDSDKNRTYVTFNLPHNTEAHTPIHDITFKYISSKGYHSMVATTLAYYDKIKKINFKSFKKLQDDTPFSSIKTINYEHQKENNIVYKDKLNKAIDKLQLPHFENENFCAKLFFPNKYSITYTNNNEIELNVFKLMEINYISVIGQISYLFVNEQNKNYTCIYSRNGSKLNENDILSIKESQPRTYYTNKNVANFISSDNNKCYSLINPGTYNVSNPIGTMFYRVIISSVNKIKYSLVNLRLDIEYKDSKLLYFFPHPGYTLNACNYHSNTPYLIPELQGNTQQGEKFKFSTVTKLK